MKKIKKKGLALLIAIVLILATSNTSALAYGTITGKEFSMNGASVYTTTSHLSSAEVTTENVSGRLTLCYLFKGGCVK